MTSVTVAEVRDQFSALLRRVADGEELVVTEDGKPVAVLGPVPPELLPPDPAAEAEARARTEEAMRSIVQTWIDDGYPPPPDSPLWEIMGRRP
jgi:prevent-host-death family protein